MTLPSAARAVLVAPLLQVALAACAPPAPDPAVIEDTGRFKIRREVLRWAAPEVPGTPGELNQVQVVRYRVDTGTAAPKPARAIAVLMPGFLGGAGSFDALARALVRRSTPEAALEAWAIDRRSNLLEDHLGLDTAIDAGNADLATSWYFEGGTIEGAPFSGFKTPADVPFMSEWGLATAMADLRAVLQKVPQADRASRVVLMGHSLGGQLVAQYAAWDFDGAAGQEDLAGVVMIDAVTGSEGQPPAITREQYETTGFAAPGGVGTVNSLAAIRAGTPYFSLPFLDNTLYAVGGITALRSLLSPAALERDVPRAEAFKVLLLTDTLPRMTNRAAFGLAFDAHTSPLAIGAVNGGEATGGPITDGASPFGTGTVGKPSDPRAKYEWLEYDQVEPREVTSLVEFATAWTRPEVDFGEWYFPSRLNLDGLTAASLTLEPGDWAYDAYGLRATHGAELELPFLVEAAAIHEGKVEAYDRLKALIRPQIGAGRPAAGAGRDSADGWDTASHPALSHLDVLCGADDEGSAVRAWFDQLAAFALRHTAPGGTVVELP